MKIAIMSDSHDNWENLEKAIQISNSEGCQFLLFAGDLIAPSGVTFLEKFNNEVIFVWGNNEGEKFIITKSMVLSKNIKHHNDIYDGEIDGIRIFMNHYPKIVELAAKSGNYDLCIHGHDHTYRVENVGNTILLNPGELKGRKTGISSFVIFDTKTKAVEKILV